MNDSSSLLEGCKRDELRHALCFWLITAESYCAGKNVFEEECRETKRTTTESYSRYTHSCVAIAYINAELTKSAM